VDVFSALGNNRPSSTGENFLLLGSDTRAGAVDNQFQAPVGQTQVTGARSDTLILAHLTPDHSHVILVSLPRDSVVRIPACPLPGGHTTTPRRDLINTAFDLGGPTCAVHTVETLTGLHIDHFVQIDFAGFERMTDALGGVAVCLSTPVNDPVSGLHLPAGTSVIKGATALAYVRARYNIGDGSDLQRITRQQHFLSAVARKAASTHMLTNPIGLYDFLDALSQSVTTDPGLTFSDLRSLALDLRGLSPSHVSFGTVPLLPGAPPGWSGHVAWDPTASAAVWAALRSDTPLGSTSKSPTSASGTTTNAPASTSHSGTPSPTQSPLHTFNASEAACD
jgi:LCP family protein required for cell wall assembly